MFFPQWERRFVARSVDVYANETKRTKLSDTVDGAWNAREQRRNGKRETEREREKKVSEEKKRMRHGSIA